MGVTIEVPGGGRHELSSRDADRLVQGLRQRAAGFLEPVADPAADVALAAAQAIEHATDEGQPAKLGEQAALDVVREVLETMCRHGADPEAQALLHDLGG